MAQLPGAEADPQPAPRSEPPSADASVVGEPEQPQSMRDLPALVLKIPRAVSQAPADVVGDTAEHLATKPVTEMREILQIQPGVNMVEMGGPVRTSFPTIRGSLPRHVRVMVDDIPLNFNDEGAANVNLVPPIILDQVQVWKGGSSAVYGSGLGGTVQLRTIDPPVKDGVHGTTRARYGTWDTSASETLVRLREGKVGFVGAGTYGDSEGYRPRSGYYDRREFSKLTYDFTEDTRLLLAGGVSEAALEDFEYPDFGFWDQVDTTARYGQASLQVGRFSDLEFSLTASGFDHFIRRDTNAIGPGGRLSRMELGSLTEAVSSEVAWQTHHRLWNDRVRLANRLAFGLDVERDIVDYEEMADPIRYSKRGAYVRDTLAWGRAALTVGGRLDDSTAYGEYLSPEAGLVVNLPGDHVILRANATRSWSAPPILWRYYSSPWIVANPDIGAEEAVTVDAGFDVDLGNPLWLRVSTFQSTIDNALDARFVGPFTRIMENSEEHRRRGIEVQMEHRVGRFVFSESAFWGVTEDLQTHETVDGRVRESYRVGLAYVHPRGWSTGVQGRYEDWNQQPVIEPDERHMLWDARLGYGFSVEKVTGEVFLIGRNILDTSWALDAYAPMPGASVEAGLSLSF